MWHRNLVQKNCCLPVMRELILHADTVKQVRPWTRDLSIQQVQRNCKMAKELGSVCNLSAMFTSIQGFVSKEPRGDHRGNNFARLLWQASVTARNAIGCGICQAS